MENKNIYQKLFEVKKAGIKLQRDTKAYNYKYATLDQIQKKLGDILEKEKLLILHKVLENKVITTIYNLDNIEEKIESEIEMTENIKPQDKGSEITYYRRYNLLSLLDLEVEDDDGSKAQNSDYKNYSRPKKKALVSKNEACPSCGLICENIKKGKTKEGKDYELANCECGTNFFINRK